ncbi:hypothetical protein KC19_1G007100 [Ceratodon purpureus]|uniref:Uncharacterized protein n=1 Tax=Ceratodon purpureus TaxID=3225 RepID=A0A8T0J2R3_CERPU|nr:hypothetical protein KC19_1G007100 [Ceratodon purpureus]
MCGAMEVLVIGLRFRAVMWNKADHRDSKSAQDSQSDNYLCSSIPAGRSVVTLPLLDSDLLSKLVVEM